MILADDESFAFDKIVINSGAAHILRVRFWGGC